MFKAGVTMGATTFGIGLNSIGALIAMGPAGPVAAAGIIVNPSFVAVSSDKDLRYYLR
jgi:hypothetical protein